MSLTAFGERLELRSEVEILADPAQIWRVLLDFPKHQRWNPFWAHLQGQALLGSRITLELTPPGGSNMRLRRLIRTCDPERELGWTGGYGWGWLLRSDQFFRLTEVENGRTRLVVAENLRGPGVTSNNLTTLDIARGQAFMNQALKRYVETGKR
jgi:hypothetical protein